MFYWLFRHVGFLRKALPKRGDSSRQLALGVALGLMVGLIPKGNLTAIAISVVIFASMVNLGTAMITATITSLVSNFVDPLLHRIGVWVLQHEALVPYWTDLSQQPVAPWTSFNNTVVMGGFVAGLVLFYPSYRASRFFFERYWIKAPTDDELPVEDETHANTASHETENTADAVERVNNAKPSITACETATVPTRVQRDTALPRDTALLQDAAFPQDAVATKAAA